VTVVCHICVNLAIPWWCRANQCDIWSTEVGKRDACYYRRILGWQHLH